MHDIDLTHHKGSALSVFRDSEGIVLSRSTHGQMVIGSVLTLTDNEARALIKALGTQLPNPE